MTTTPTQPVKYAYTDPTDIRCTRCGRILAKHLEGSVELKCRGCKHTQKYSS
jgi:phage FluMu protein Com